MPGFRAFLREAQRFVVGSFKTEKPMNHEGHEEEQAHLTSLGLFLLFLRVLSEAQRSVVKMRLFRSY